jgi:hypothetical protein
VSRRIPAAILTAVSGLLSAVPFMTLVQLGVDVVKIHRGFAAFAGMASPIPIALGEITFVNAVGPWYRRADSRGRLASTSLAVIGVECLALPLIEAIRFALYLPATGGHLAAHTALLRPLSLPVGLAGLGLGIAALTARAVVNGGADPFSRRDR